MTERMKIFITLMGLSSMAVILSVASRAQDIKQRYLLQPGDEVTVQYRYTPEFDQTAKLHPDGFVSLEVVGDVHLGGLTINQARDLILQKAGIRLKDPEITLALKDFEKPYVVVAGEVSKPGKFELRDDMTALQAIMLAGGFKDQANLSQVVVFRRLNTELSETKVLNFKNASRKGGQFQDLTLQPGDMLMVPQSTITRIERYMKVANVGVFFNPLQWLF